MTTSDTIPTDPIARFSELLAQATRIDRAMLPEPTAFTLASVSADGQPSARILLLKHVDERGFVFYTNFESRKGRELLGTQRAAMCFHWQLLERQVRVEGSVAPVSDQEADAYFASRARGSQLGAWASQQSRAMRSPSDLDARLAGYEAEFASGPVPRPPYWSGFRLSPQRIEFWHNMPSRLHQRHVYERDGSGWRTGLLYP